MNVVILEKDIQRSILDYLALKRVFHWRNNTGAFKGEHNGKTRFVKYGTLGSPDIFALHKGILYGIEVKRPGGKQTEGQRLFEFDMTQNGGVYRIAQSIDDIKDLF